MIRRYQPPPPPFRVAPTSSRSRCCVALQGAIALSPLLESNERGRMPVHVEQQGATHQYQHDEATCAVCTVRALHSSPAQACPAIACERQQAVAALDAPATPLHGVETTALPRAPPPLT